MSKNKLPEQTNPEEVDLGLMFGYIEKVFRKLGIFIKNIFIIVLWTLKKLLLLLLFSFKIIKNHIIVIFLGTIITYFIVGFLGNRQEPIYQSTMLIKQNYPSGDILYNQIARYGLLARTRDSVGLSKELNIPITSAANFNEFNIRNREIRNDMYLKYSSFNKEMDTSLVSFSEFSAYYPKEKEATQVISVYSTDPNLFNGLDQKLVNILNSNSFLTDLRDRNLKDVQDKMDTYTKLLIESDSLQRKYIDLLDKYYSASIPSNNPNTTLNLNLDSSKEKINTKEYDLFEQQKIMSIEISELRKNLENKKQIFELKAGFSQPSIIENKYQKNRILYTIIVGGIIFMFFFLKELDFYNVIEEYGNKEKLLEK